MSNNPPTLKDVGQSLDEGAIILCDETPSDAPQEAAQADAATIVGEFRNEWLKKGSGVLDAWYDQSDDAIKCLVDIGQVSQGKLPGVQKHYRGKRTELTIFGRA